MEGNMSRTQSDLDQTRLALAALTACVVQTLRANGVIAQSDFDRYLERAYGVIRDKGGDNIGALEVLSWTREIEKAIEP
jgi:hypothetical protein